MDICLHTNLQITEKYIGGTERFLLSYAKELNNLGYNAFILCSSLMDKVIVEGIPVYGVVPKRYRDKAKSYQSLSSNFIFNEIIKDRPIEDSLIELSNYTDEQLSAVQADVYHLNSFISAAYLDPLKRKYIVYNHENNTEINDRYGFKFFDGFSNLIQSYRTNLHKFKLFAPSSYYSIFYENNFNCKIEHAKLGINLIDFSYGEKSDTLRRETFEDFDGYIFLLPSRFKIEQKGHDIALKAMSIIRDNGISFKLLITGVKPYEVTKVQEFNTHTKELGIHRHVVMSSYSDMNLAYQNCDCVISPERYCSYGLSVSESLSLGIPTIMSDIPTYKEIGESYAHAHFFECGNPSDLAYTLMKLIQTNLLTRDRKNAIKFRVNNDIRDCAKTFSNLYIKSD